MDLEAFGRVTRGIQEGPAHTGIYGSEGWGSESLIGCCLCGPQAFEQAPEERFVPRQACCPVGVSLAMSRSECCLPIALSAGLLPMDIVCSLRQVA